jgi:hypothetical protein
MSPPTTTGRRILVVANDTVSGQELTRRVRESGGEDAAVFVVAPALTSSAIKHHLGDVDQAREPAQERLERILAELRDAGIAADGEVGDSDPLVAVGDELRKFPADEIVLIHHPDEEAAHAEKGLLERLKRDFDKPVTEVVVPAAGGEEPLAVRREAGGAGRREETGPTRGYNLPRFEKKDVVAMILGSLGAGLTIVLAADCAAGGEDGIHTGRCAWMTLIAIAITAINGAHIVGLTLFETVRYHGLWQRFAARLSISLTAVAVIASLVLRLA